jgi:photosystem II stability/assembly factor-like uncharacterized protein
MRRLIFFLGLISLFVPLHAQWELQESHSTSGLRGIHNVDGRIAWASGEQGTVLRTLDGGRSWQRCAVPLGAEQLDFRGIQAFDENTAIVMSSGPGAQSRVYRTRDGCATWELAFTNPDKGSFKAMQFIPGSGRDKGRVGVLVGDPTSSILEGTHFAIFRTYDYGKTWEKTQGPWRAPAKAGEMLLAASNSALIEVRGSNLFVTGGAVTRSRTLEEHVKHDPHIVVLYVGGDLPLRHGAEAGAASVAAHLGPESNAAADAKKYIVRAVHAGDVLVAVGGDPRQPDIAAGNCAVSIDGSLNWSVPLTSPRGYRSAVAYDPQGNYWITVGPNGTDVSTDDGRNWRPLTPTAGEPADADKNWNSLSLPFAVGPNGRIGKLRGDAVKP